MPFMRIATAPALYAAARRLSSPVSILLFSAEYHIGYEEGPNRLPVTTLITANILSSHCICCQSFTATSVSLPSDEEAISQKGFATAED
jgi:hypothetical protein